MHSIKLSEYRIGIKFDKDPLAIEQNNYLSKTVNVHVVYDFDFWSSNTFRFKNFLFRATNIVKNSDKENYVYSGYGITFDISGSSNFGNNFAGNDTIFGVDNSSSSHANNLKNKFLVLGELHTFGNNESFCAPEKKFSINFNESNTKYYFSFYYNADTWKRNV